MIILSYLSLVKRTHYGLGIRFVRGAVLGLDCVFLSYERRLELRWFDSLLGLRNAFLSHFSLELLDFMRLGEVTSLTWLELTIGHFTPRNGFFRWYASKHMRCRRQLLF